METPAPRMPVPEPPKTAARMPKSTDFLALARQEKADKAQELEALKDAILDMMVNDLKDPLTVIQGNVSQLLDDAQDLGSLSPAKMESVLRTCLANCKKQMNLIMDLQDVCQFNQDKYPLKKSPAYFPKLVDDCLEALAPVIRSKEISVKKVYHGQIPLVQVDEGVIRRVLVNLLTNALKYAAPDGKIMISVNLLDSGWLECVVEDNGMVIPREHLGKVFDKFFKGDYFGRFRKGQGLGLAFCRLAVEAHGGDIWAERSLPKGNRFVMVLPRDGKKQS